MTRSDFMEGMEKTRSHSGFDVGAEGKEESSGMAGEEWGAGGERASGQVKTENREMRADLEGDR